MWKQDAAYPKFSVLDVGKFCANVTREDKRWRPKGAGAWRWQVSRIYEKPCWTISSLGERSEGYCNTRESAMLAAEARLREAGARIVEQK
jgi:hypothetical protein